MLDAEISSVLISVYIMLKFLIFLFSLYLKKHTLRKNTKKDLQH